MTPELLARLQQLCREIRDCRDDLAKLARVEAQNDNERRILAGAVKDARDRNRLTERKEKHDNDISRK